MTIDLSAILNPGTAHGFVAGCFCIPAGWAVGSALATLMGAE